MCASIDRVAASRLGPSTACETAGLKDGRVREMTMLRAFRCVLILDAALPRLLRGAGHQGYEKQARDTLAQVRKEVCNVGTEPQEVCKQVLASGSREVIILREWESGSRHLMYATGMIEKWTWEDFEATFEYVESNRAVDRFVDLYQNGEQEGEPSDEDIELLHEALGTLRPSTAEVTERAQRGVHEMPEVRRLAPRPKKKRRP